MKTVRKGDGIQVTAVADGERHRGGYIRYVRALRITTDKRDVKDGV